MIQQTYRVWCSTDSKWEFVTQDKGLAVPTVCPTNGGHTVDTNLTSIIGTDEQVLKGCDQSGASAGDVMVCYGEDDWRVEPNQASALTHYEVTATNQVTMSGSTWLDLPDMTITPTAGIYYCIIYRWAHIRQMGWWVMKIY